MSLVERVAAARERLARAGIPGESAGLDAEVLARHLLGWDRATYLAARHRKAPASFEARYEALVERRARREPVSVITGRREFWGLELEVTRDVLAPRPETELIVEAALALAAAGAPLRTIIDVGTGSGCLAVALARELPDASVVATDISPAALAVARRNAARHGVKDRIRWVRTDLLDGLAVEADLVVANPPYLAAPAAPELQPEVRDYEPVTALLAGADGLDVVRALLSQVESRLAPGGCLIVEFGFGQEPAIRSLVEARPGLDLVRMHRDLQGIPRTAVVRRKAS